MLVVLEVVVVGYLLLRPVYQDGMFVYVAIIPLISVSAIMIAMLVGTFGGRRNIGMTEGNALSAGRPTIGTFSGHQ